MKNPLWTLGNAVLGGLAGYLISTGREPEGIIIFVVIVVLTASKVFDI